MSASESTAYPAHSAPPSLPDQDLSWSRERLSISGMHCAACVQLIEFRVRQLDGVKKFQINPASRRAELIWDDGVIGVQKIITAIVSLGYGALPAGQSTDEVERKENKLAIWRLFVAGFAMMQIMMYAFPGYLVPVPQADGDLTPDMDRLLKIASLVITVPVIGFSALPFFRSALRDLRHRHIGMDVPVSLGILLTFFASIWATFKGGAVYFDSAIMFVFLLLGARLIESRVQKKTTAAVRVLTQLVPVRALKLLNFPATRQTEEVDAAQLISGDRLLVPPGEHIPADGKVLEGHSECDESLMTGESRPVLKQAGDSVIAGAVNLNAPLVIEAQQVGNDTRLSELIAMMESAATEKPPIVLLADRHASRFLILILLIALIAGVVWAFVDPSRALWIAVSIIVVTCPCALSLATPGVMSAAIGILAQNGVLIKNGKALQGLSKATHIIFDKTGTLTAGRLSVAEIATLRDDANARQIAFQLASASAHPAAKAIADGLAAACAANDHIDMIACREIPGGGMEASVAGRVYRLGQVAFAAELSEQAISVPAPLSGKTVSVLADERGGLLMFALDDILRDDAASVIAALKSAGKQVLLLSGDREEVVVRVAAECGIEDARAQLSPADKFRIVEALQQRGAQVVMIGDGMNDGPVLSRADVSVAMGQGAPISQIRSDMLLMSNRLRDLQFGLTIAGSAMRLIKENLAWAILYNLIAIPAAALGYLEPWHAALGMSLSSLIVILNALRLYLIPQPVRQTLENLSK